MFAIVIGSVSEIAQQVCALNSQPGEWVGIGNAREEWSVGGKRKLGEASGEDGVLKVESARRVRYETHRDQERQGGR